MVARGAELVDCCSCKSYCAFVEVVGVGVEVVGVEVVGVGVEAVGIEVVG